MKMNHRSIACLTAGLLSACAARQAPDPGPGQALTSSAAPSAQPGTRELPVREGLPPAVREALNARMARHGEQFTFLLANVVMLDYESAAELADELVNEPPLGRPLPEDRESLNAMLPAAFFDYQDQLRARATVLGQAARAKDRAQLVATFGNLAETCVGCHAAYLHDELPVHADEP